MAPNISMPTGVLHEHDDEVRANFIPPEVVKPSDRKLELVWRNIILFAYLHLIGLYGFYLMFTSAKLATSIQAFILYQWGSLGVTAGAHRLWSHRSYKAKWPLRLILTIFNTLAFEPRDLNRMGNKRKLRASITLTRKRAVKKRWRKGNSVLPEHSRLEEDLTYQSETLAEFSSEKENDLEISDIQNEDIVGNNSSDESDEYLIEPDIPESTFNITGRKIIDISFFWKQIQQIKHVPSFQCTLENCKIAKERRLGLHSNSVIEWARDHRVHHKFSETDADPHNAKRGFFFSHVGWLLCRKHPEVKNKGKGIDMSDLQADPMLDFQDKYYLIVMPLVCFILPTVGPMYLWNETFLNAFCVNLFRYCFTLHVTWLVNSAAHLYGQKPYDNFSLKLIILKIQYPNHFFYFRYINPAENLTVAILALGEGWHNYHHTFPWDYKTSELGKYSVNFTAAFIDFFAKIGWAYELKTVPEEMVRKRVLRTGDGTHEVWGWGDKDQPIEDYNEAIITHKKQY
ncbi:hypothetical protein NQ314_019409 [Rhamnusium bicolor]|uniref:Fatty acid desaturase domain-containing protein n=1 Tax=Rhamnusium bicolor TaxID=1586634 RepID=A0AAV8WPH4_9CUCU|nr:hypothetical protein NQ314_019409 [Rhamnusium bicolor]